MEEEKSSRIEEASDLTSLGNPPHRCKRSRAETDGFSTKFKGVVPQPNGHCGAQIYANHQRIWLGTFKSETEAAMAYDSASIKLRTGDNQRNFPWTSVTIHEPKFQSLHSTEAVLSMIRDGSYPFKFSGFLKSRIGKFGLGQDLMTVHENNAGASCKLLFQKELTPSDVGKLNRLVIPKRYAVKFFPSVEENSEMTIEGGKMEEVHLCFYDRLMRLWKFRYCYWKSSQSFVLTRGWNRFVKEKNLKPNDVIAFYICEGEERAREGQAFCIIDVFRSSASRNARENVDMQSYLRLERDFKNQTANEQKEEFEDQEVITRLEAAPNGKKRVRLFGVQIN
ncbi:hypothetical protein NMG60_11030930 [Bertholletia excelsa]